MTKTEIGHPEDRSVPFRRGTGVATARGARALIDDVAEVLDALR